MKMKYLINLGAALAMGAASLAVTATPAMNDTVNRAYASANGASSSASHRKP